MRIPGDVGGSRSIEETVRTSDPVSTDLRASVGPSRSVPDSTVGSFFGGSGAVFGSASGPFGSTGAVVSETLGGSSDGVPRFRPMIPRTIRTSEPALTGVIGSSKAKTPIRVIKAVPAPDQIA